MPNSITNTVSGKFAYEDFASQTDGADATSSQFTLAAPAGQKWIIKTVGTENFIRPSDTSFSDINSGFKKTFNAGSMCLSQFSYCVGNASYTNLMRFAGSTGGTIYHALQGHRIYFTGGYSNTGIFTTDTSFVATYSSSAIYTVQSYFKSGVFKFGVWRDTTKVFSTEAPASTITYPTGSAEKWWGSQMGATTSYIGRALLQSGGLVTFDGLTSGMTINLLNSTTEVVEYSLYATGATVSKEFSLLEMFPLNKKIQIIGTDGSELLKTTAQSIFGGDTWTYSGDTAGITKSRKRIIIDGGVIG